MEGYNALEGINLEPFDNLGGFMDTLTGGVLIFVVGVLLFLLLYFIAWVLIFKKAGKSVWAISVPFHNIVVMLELSGLPGWMVFSPFIILLLMFFVPPIVVVILNIGLYILLNYMLAKSFNKSIGFIIGLIILPFIFYPILGFNRDKYIGPGGKQLDSNTNVANDEVTINQDLNKPVTGEQSTVTSHPQGMVLTEETQPEVIEELSVPVTPVNDLSQSVPPSPEPVPVFNVVPPINMPVNELNNPETIMKQDINPNVTNEQPAVVNHPQGVVLTEETSPEMVIGDSLFADSEGNINQQLTNDPSKPMFENTPGLDNPQSGLNPCPNCGTNVKVGETTCFMCGTKI